MLKRMEQKERERVSALIDLGEISEIQLFSIKDFLGEKYIHYEISIEDGMVKLSFPEISTAEFQDIISVLKEKNIKFDIKEVKEK